MKNTDHLRAKDAQRQVTLETVKKMSDRVLRYRVAELFGWKLWLEKRGEYLWVIPQLETGREPWKSYRDSETEKQRYSPLSFSHIDYQKHIYSPVDKIIPDYPHDLNAVHEVEKILTTMPGFGQLSHYRLTVLPQVCGGDAEAITATARQRCEALALCLFPKRDNDQRTAEKTKRHPRMDDFEVDNDLSTL